MWGRAQWETGIKREADFSASYHAVNGLVTGCVNNDAVCQKTARKGGILLTRRFMVQERAQKVFKRVVGAFDEAVTFGTMRCRARFPGFQKVTELPNKQDIKVGALVVV
ncbi:unnamed protein product [Echinostoma caproni]|uniref:Transposase n=1 Tax=Echinostoma caproni TaxID=27848 RepID=A0A183A214_9TREM|nr:unnamed protein product [Echinostoma caproni]